MPVTGIEGGAVEKQGQVSSGSAQQQTRLLSTLTAQVAALQKAEKGHAEMMTKIREKLNK